MPPRLRANTNVNGIGAPVNADPPTVSEVITTVRIKVTSVTHPLTPLISKELNTPVHDHSFPLQFPTDRTHSESIP